MFGSGDCVTASQVVARSTNSRVAGVLIGRGALRNPWIFKQAAALAGGHCVGEVSRTDRAQFLLDYIDLLLREGIDETAGFRHAMSQASSRSVSTRHAKGRERWVVNKLRALGSWYTKGLNRGSQLRTEINHAASVSELRDIIRVFFQMVPAATV